ncbi:MAG: ATP-binding protein [Aggregatilineales bacterium]
MDSDQAYAQENPYAPSHAFQPFAGREDAFARLQNHLNNPAGTSPPVFLGRAKIGKTALLKQVTLAFGETYVSVYLPINPVTLGDEIIWITTLANTLRDAAEIRGYLMPHPPEFPDDDEDEEDTTDIWREWLREECLPHLIKGIRPQRQFVLLLDDAHLLIDALRSKTLPPDSVDYLQTLLSPQFGMAMAMPESYEEALGEFAPLVTPSASYRLGYLPESVMETLFLTPVRGQYTVSEEALHSIFMATGGIPAMLQRFGFHLYERITEKRAPFGQLTATIEDVRAVRDAVYAEWSPEFQTVWGGLGLDEKLFLTALGSLYYADPVSPIGIERLAEWLIETDYPLDTTAISAVFRELEYENVIAGNATAMTFTSDLFRRWVLENARMEGTPVIVRATSEEGDSSRWLWVLIAVAVLLLLAVLLTLSLGGGGDASEIIPTVTLLPQG